MSIYQKWARRPQSEKRRILTLLLAGFLFLFLLPFVLVTYPPRLDDVLDLPSFYLGWVNIVVGVMVILSGGFFALWSIWAEFTIGSGTPLPMMPTQKLVVIPPFTYSRNPMTLGTIIAYSGIGVCIGSISEILIVLTFGALLLCYVKFLEEKELEQRFGQEYVDYKKKTPFIIPRFWKGK
jgi:protein-S-isoprenylcysteine O-methyltransferase Ste14